MIALIVFAALVLPSSETYVYETNNKGKLGKMEIKTWLDSLGYRAVYVWEDRIQEILLDADDMSTRQIRKTIAGKLDYQIIRTEVIRVFFQGRRATHHERDPVYDRHAIEFALRGFEYCADFDRTIKLHVPELGIINARISVDGRERLSTELGDLDCWKVKMSPKVLFLKWNFYFWIEVEYPHRFVRYSDSSGKNTINLIEYFNHGR